MKENKEDGNNNNMNNNNYQVKIIVNDNYLIADIVDNKATLELKKMLEQGNLTYQANDYGGFEKVGSIGFSLPTENKNIKAEAGDIMLYQGNQFCIFFSSNSWGYTRIGKINNKTSNELREFFGTGSVEIEIELIKE